MNKLFLTIGLFAALTFLGFAGSASALNTIKTSDCTPYGAAEFNQCGSNKIPLYNCSYGSTVAKNNTEYRHGLKDSILLASSGTTPESGCTSAHLCKGGTWDISYQSNSATCNSK